MAKFAIAVAQARAARLGFCAILCMAVLSCGGSDGGKSGGSPSGGTTPPTGSNVVSVVVDAGPTGVPDPDVNTLFTSVTVCVPGSTSKCQTIDHIQVDTGSYGLRILSSVLTLALPVQTASNGEAIVECTVFADAYSWGPVALADMKISGEVASSLPIQVIGDPNYANVPGDCSGAGSGNAEDTVAAFGANGVLGIGPFAQDCGPNCQAAAQPTTYYTCTASACQPTALAQTHQVANPITYFATDNNGVIIQLPSVAADGAATVTGTMIFGVDTETNNKSDSQTVVTVAGSAGGTTPDQMPGQFTTLFNGANLDESFLDTGSNALFFNDSNLTICTESGLVDFYCPPSTENLSGTIEGQNAISVNVDFSVTPADSLSGGEAAFSNLAGPYPDPTDTHTFDWGLPFFYGKTVYTVIEGDTTTVGTGPYVAF